MRDVTRIEPMLEELKSVWEQYPDLRLGQLICDIVPEEKLFYIEDDLMLERIKNGKNKYVYSRGSCARLFCQWL